MASDAVVALVTKAGTSDEVIATVQQPAFLSSCLRKAKLDAELLDDIAEACEMNEFTALLLGSGQLTVKATADLLYLMEDEAASLIKTCKTECGRAGINFGDGAIYEPAEEEEPAPTTAPAPAAAAPVAPAVPEPPTRAPAASVYDHEEDVADEEEEGPVAPAAPSSVPPPPAEEPKVQQPQRQTQAQPQTQPQPQPVSEPVPALPVPAPVVPASKPAPAAHTPPVRSGIPRPASSTQSASHSMTRPASASASHTPTSAAAPASRRPMRAGSGETPGAAAAGTPSSSPAVPKALSRPISARTPVSNVKSSTIACGSTGNNVVVAAAAAAAKQQAAAKRRPQSASLAAGPSPAAATPRYARPTASAKARHTADEEGTPTVDHLGSVDSHSTPLPLNLSVHHPTSAPHARRGGPEATPPASNGVDSPQADTSPRMADRKKRTVFAHISSSLLRPTKAFLAWTSGNQRGADGQRTGDSETPSGAPPARSHYQVPKETSSTATSSMRKSTTVLVDASSPTSGEASAPGSATKAPKAAHATTRFQPFNLTEAKRTVAASLTTEELQLAKAQEQGSFKARPLPKFMKQRKTPVKEDAAALADVTQAVETLAVADAPASPQ